jgi:NADH-quinone oxidoreductase subunit C
MTAQLPADSIARLLESNIPGVVEGWEKEEVRVQPESLMDICRFLKTEPRLQMDYLVAISAVDYIDHFEIVYHLASLGHNHAMVLKTRVYDRESPAVPSVVGIWQGANLQEREIWDLMGVSFTGHPNMKRILTWEGFPGHPLQKSHLGG